MADSSPAELQGNLRVLFVDDEANHLELSKLYLEEADPSIEMVAVSSPVEALRLVRGEFLECVVSDYVMPGMDGIQLCREVRSIVDVPFIIYTGRGSEEVAEKAFAAGVSDYIRKEREPSHYQVLAKRIRQAVERHRLEQLYRTVVEDNRDALAIIQETTLVYANRAMAKLLAVSSPNDIIGKDILQWVTEEDRETIRERKLGRQRGEPRPRFYEYTLRRADGELRRIEVSVSLISYMGKPASLALNRDITERKRMEEQLRDSEQRFRALAEPNIIGILSADLERIINANDAFLKIVGYTREDLEEGRILWKEMTPPEYHALDERALEELRATGSCKPFEKEYFRRDGGRVPILIGAALLQREPLQWVCFVMDNTERKKAEEALAEDRNVLQGIMENSSAMLAYFDPDFNFVMANPTYVNASGHSAEELIGRNHFDLFPNEENEAIFRRVRDTGEAVTFHDKPFEYADQPERGITYWDWTLAPVKDDTGHVQGLVLSLMETTQRKKTEDALRLANEKLREYASKLEQIVDTQARDQGFKNSAKKIFDICKGLIKANSGYVALLSLDGQKNEVLFLDSGGLPCTVDPKLPMPIRGLRAEVYKTGKTVYHNDFSNSDWARLMPEGHIFLENVLFAPLTLNGRVVGLLGLANKTGGFDEDDARIATAFGEFLATSLSLSRTLDALSETERKYRTLVESLNEGLWVIDKDAYTTFVNDRMAEMLSYTVNEMIGRHLFEFMDEKGVETAKRNLERRRSGVREQHDFEFVRKDGKHIYTTLETSPIYDEKGNYAGAIAGIIDISDRKRMEDALRLANEELESANHELKIVKDRLEKYTNNLETIVDEKTREIRETKERLEAFMDASINPIAIFDSALRLKDISKIGFSGFPQGTRKEDLIGKHVTEVLPGIEGTEIYEGFKRVLETGEPLRSCVYRSHLFSSDIWVEIIAFKVGNGLGIISRDVTEQKLMEDELRRSEEMFRVSMENQIDPFGIYRALRDESGRIVDFIVDYVNEAACRANNMTREQQIGKRLLEILPAHRETGLFEEYCTLVETGKPLVKDAMAYSDYFGGEYKIKIVDVRAAKLADGFVATWRDVTQREQARERLRQAEKMDTISRMGATVAHDLRGPLSTIIQAAEMAKSKPDRAERMLRMIEDSADRSLNMIEYLRTGTREITPRLEDTDLNALIRKAAEESMIPESVRVELDLGEDTGKARIDPGILRRVMDNLVRNAVEAMPSGGDLTLRTRRADDTIQIEVTDTGTGIPKENIPQIFEPFFTTKPKGMGLGLPYCRRAIESHGGTISLETEEGKGTTFIITLPMKPWKGSEIRNTYL